MGRNLLAVVLASALALALSGCIVEDDDAGVTCDNFHRLLVDCTANCSVTWDCEREYRSLPIDDQIDLDDCSDCMVRGGCGDCSLPGRGVPSCWDFMELLLGADCW